MIRAFVLSGLAAGSLLLCPGSEAQRHAGKMDTDGHLSPGELRNPRINYGDRWDNDRHRHDGYHGHDHDSRYDDSYGRPDYSGSAYPIISNGVRSGRISRREEAELREASEDLQRRENYYREDGRLSRWEVDDLRDREESLRGKIEHELNDGEKRWG